MVVHICNKINDIYTSAFAEQTKLSRAVYLLFPIPGFKLLVHELQDAFVIDRQQKNELEITIRNGSVRFGSVRFGVVRK